MNRDYIFLTAGMNNNTHLGIVVLWLIMCGRNQVFRFVDLSFTVQKKEQAKKTNNYII